jgi:hypothetical protein
MFARSAAAFARPIRATVGRRGIGNAGLPGALYTKSTAVYVSMVVVGLVFADIAFHSVFESMWDASNKGVSHYPE